MRVKISNSLKNLSKLFATPLYITGGAVRDYLSGFNAYDFDIASEASPREVYEFLKGSSFSISPTSEKLGTLKIYDGENSFEYTTFRKDSYPNDGSHQPIEVTFTKDLVEDASRRDFTVNAIYFDIQSEKFIDPLGGIEDIKQKLIKTAREPEKVFEEDALRIVRMARLAAETGFSISEETFASAKKLSDSVSLIAKERLRDELMRILLSDGKNGIVNGPIKGLRILVESGAMAHIIPEILEGIGIEQRKDFHKYDVFNHALEVVRLSDKDIRLAALFHDIAKPKMLRETGRMAGHDKAGAEITRMRMNELKFPKAFISETVELVEAHMFDLKTEARDSKVRLFIQKHFHILDKLMRLKQADFLGGGLVSGESPTVSRLKSVYEDMKKNNVPFSLKDLKVGGKELIALAIPEKLRGEVLKALLTAAATDGNLLSYDAQLNFIQKYKF